ncbi:MerR family transcriptional regulator [Pseudoclavibacter helvolus]|uniref:MerR family transcriptional regulator n=1 Tax=Pseudoclavibacter helvolus TaxID=255205 RepID=UPI003C72F031
MHANTRTVGAVSTELGVSVRTLHHWEEVGLAHPVGRTPGGYRAYDEREIARLRRVLMFRDLGIPLSEISALLGGTGADRRQELKARRAELAAKIAHLQRLAREVDALIEADQHGPLLGDAESAAAFGPDWNPDWARQAQERWGDTAQWAEYAERSARRSPQGWQEVTAAVREVASEMGAAKRGGVAPDSPEAAKLVERHRQAFGEFFHCTLSMHVVLGRMTESEADRRAFYDGVEAGLAAWMREAIDEAARRSGIDPDAARWE